MPEAARARRPASLALRVIALVGISMALVLAAFSWISARALDRHFVEMDEAELRAVAAAVMRAVEEAPAGELPELAPAIRGHHGVHFLLVDPGRPGESVLPGHGPDLARLARDWTPLAFDGPWPLAVWEEGGTHYRGASIALPQRPGLRLALAMDIDTHEHFIREFRRIQRWTFTLAMALVVAVAGLAVRWGHAPIRRSNARIRAIGSARLHLRLDPKAVPVELSDTIAAFNDLMGRLEDSFAQLANFSADIAHELRTPLALLQAEIEAAQDGVRPLDARTLAALHADTLRLGRLVEDLHELSLTDLGALSYRKTDLDPLEVLASDLEAFRPRFVAADIGLRLEDQHLTRHHLRLHGDGQRLSQLFRNLLRNSLQYTDAGGELRIGLSLASGRPASDSARSATLHPRR